MPLREVDKVEILTLLDNTIDILMADTPQAKRFPLRSDALTRESLVAEHGFAALVSVSSSNTSESLLFDAGLSKNGLAGERGKSTLHSKIRAGILWT
jgi:7,8-dihydropterin-6-yl-methyl-4-(beta-D-ribofuranosyl)aminobenzene 5'-phosphate synthase